jgi:hypothetical protein
MTWRRLGFLLALTVVVLGGDAVAAVQKEAPAAQPRPAGSREAAPTAQSPPSRAEEALAKRREKAAHTPGYRPNRVETTFFTIENSRLFTRIFNPPQGAFAVVGGPGEGAGFGGGGGYRLGTETTHLTLAATGSFKRYWQLDALFRAQDLADGRAYVEIGVRHRDAPRENFFGLGSSTSLDDRTSYALQMTTVTGGGGVEIGRDVTLSADVEYLRPRVGAGQDDRHLSIEQRFSDLDAPGLTTEPELLHAGATLAYEGRDQPGNPRRGGRYAASWGHTQDLDEDRYAFQRLMFDVEQVIPFWSEQRRIVLRGVAVQTDPDEGREVPFYLMPALGGGNTLRGFKQDRFRDRSALLLRAEYRYELNAFLVAALFTDVGQVAPSWGDMRRRDFKRNYGFGLRFGTATVVLRTDVAFGSGEGTRLVLRFGGAF